jgi:hypothetical protein
LLKGKYSGFGPTLAAEKLFELEGKKVSSETIRLWMIERHLWVVRSSRKKSHPPRTRRHCFGELIQADGSHHRWFGDDGPEVNATVLIDDATSCLTGLYLSEQETLESYFNGLLQHFNEYGLPRALYTDRYSIFPSYKKGNKTQMHMALDALGIELIFANSPFLGCR